MAHLYYTSVGRLKFLTRFTKNSEDRQHRHCDSNCPKAGNPLLSAKANFKKSLTYFHFLSCFSSSFSMESKKSSAVALYCQTDKAHISCLMPLFFTYHAYKINSTTSLSVDRYNLKICISHPVVCKWEQSLLLWYVSQSPYILFHFCNHLLNKPSIFQSNLTTLKSLKISYCSLLYNKWY